MRLSATDAMTADSLHGSNGTRGGERAVLGVAGKVTRIVDAFRDGGDYLMLDDIVGITGFPRSTSSRILRQLIDEGWIEHNARGYRIGPGLSALTADSTKNERLRAAAGVALNGLHAFTGAVAHLTVLDGGLVVYLDKIGGKAESSIASRVGGRILASESPSGMAMLSYLSEDEISMRLGRYLDSVRLATVRAEALRIRHNRMPFVYKETLTPQRTYSIAVPIVVRGDAMAAISLGSRCTLSRTESYPLLRRAAQHIAENLGGEQMPSA